jgi:hypothetical protein
MELQKQQQRRPRSQPRKTTGVVVRTENDVRGIAEPLERYGELLACQVVGLYNAIHGLSARSEHFERSTPGVESFEYVIDT